MVRTQVSMMTSYEDCWITCDSNRVIQYNATNVVFHQIIMQVKGWFEKVGGGELTNGS